MKLSCLVLGICAISSQVSPALGTSSRLPLPLSPDGIASPAGFGTTQPSSVWLFQDASARENQGIHLSHGPSFSTGLGLFESTDVIQTTMTVAISSAQLYAPVPDTTDVVVRFASSASPSNPLFPIGGMPEFDLQVVGTSVTGFLHFNNVQSLLWNRIFQKNLQVQTETLTWGSGPLNAVAVPDSGSTPTLLCSAFVAACWFRRRSER